MNTVNLPQGDTGSKFFFRVLRSAADRFSIPLPASPSAFKAGYGDHLCRFEAARIASPERIAIARHLFGTMQDSLVFGEMPLSAALAQPSPAVVLQTRTTPSPRHIEVPCDGKTYVGKDILTLVDKLHAAHHMSDAARDGLRWTITHLDTIDLTGKRFALLGAGAELSPAALLLALGAHVLWIDVKQPTLSGHVSHTGQSDDLLGNPQAVMAAIRTFAQQGPVHMGLLAYAPGASRELRIAATMNAIVQALGPQVVQSVSMFISPTSPAEVSAEDLAVAQNRKRHLWQQLLARTPALRGPGAYGGVARAVISLQGQGYQAAQYLAKICCAEVLAADGQFTLSTNVAGITNTRSLEHPLFQAGFLGAPAFGVRIFEPATTRVLSGLLMLHDILNPTARASADARVKSARAEQIHGGVYALPWQFEACVRVAAVIGLGKNPRILRKRSAAAD